jgi:GT2 family glycosyltransferase
MEQQRPEPLPDAREALLDRQYQIWLARHRPSAERQDAMRRQVETFSRRPLVSLIMPVYDTPEEWLRNAIESVRAQCYPDWELCVVDDASPGKQVRRVLKKLAMADTRIRVKYLRRNEGISGASNHALAAATGEYVATMDHDDVLEPHALHEIVKQLIANPALDFVYTDHDLRDGAGRRSGPFFKPDWSPDLLLSMNYITHLSVYRRSLVEEVGGFRKGFEGAQDYDLQLRVTEKARAIGHIPLPLYSWGQAPKSIALDSGLKPYAHEAGRRALADAMRRRQVDAEVLDGYGAPFRYRVKRRILGNPLVSILIPTRDHVKLLKACIDGLEQRTAYRTFEILILDNDSKDPETLDYLARSPHRVLRYPHPFDFVRINNFGAEHARGEYILFLNDDTVALEPDWLESMLEHAQRPEVGAVGARLLFPSGELQHAGSVVGIQGKAAHAFWGFPGDHPGYYDFARVVRNYSAVTGACLMTRKDVWQEVGGFDEAFALSYNDVDLCLRIRERGYWIIYTPYATLRHHQSASRGPYDAKIDAVFEQRLRERWGNVIECDPFYNPHLTRQGFDFCLEI